jgi:hypothetical protein
VGSAKVWRTIDAMGPSAESAHQYDVCLSFAGEQRNYVEQVAKELVGRGIRVFYDGYEVANLWGKDLFEHLDHVYSKSARYCVIFVSADYARKVWTTHERKSAQERALVENHQDYILPARFDDTELPGLRSTVGYVDLRILRPSELASLIAKKVSLEDGAVQERVRAPRIISDQRDQRDAREQELKRFIRRMDRDKRFREEVIKGQGPAFDQAPLEWRVDFLRRMVNAMASAMDKKIRVPEADRIKLQMLMAEYERLRDQQLRLEGQST